MEDIEKTLNKAQGAFFNLMKIWNTWRIGRNTKMNFLWPWYDKSYCMVVKYEKKNSFWGEETGYISIHMTETDSKNLVAAAYPKRHNFSSNRRKEDQWWNPKEKMELDWPHAQKGKKGWLHVGEGNGKLKGREEWDDQNPHGKGRWKNNQGKRDGPAGLTSVTRRKKGLVGERKL